MRPEIVLIIFHTHKEADTVFNIVREKRKKWQYQGKELSLGSGPSFIFTSDSNYARRQFTGYNVIGIIDYRYFDTPETLIEKIEDFVNKEKED